MDMNKKNIRFDDELQIEAYQFMGLGQNFPNHFHDYYVIGLIEMGERRLMVNHQEYRIGPGHLLTFNPMDNHACEQMDAGGLSYRSLNIKPEIMAGVTREVLGCETPPRFCKPGQSWQHPVFGIWRFGDLFRHMEYSSQAAGSCQNQHLYLSCSAGNGCDIRTDIKRAVNHSFNYWCSSHIIRAVAIRNQSETKAFEKGIMRHKNTSKLSHFTLHQLGGLYDL